jgi:hypothetical protein
MTGAEIHPTRMQLSTVFLAFVQLKLIERIQTMLLLKKHGALLTGENFLPYPTQQCP